MTGSRMVTFVVESIVEVDGQREIDLARWDSRLCDIAFSAARTAAAEYVAMVSAWEGNSTVRIPKCLKYSVLMRYQVNVSSVR